MVLSLALSIKTEWALSIQCPVTICQSTSIKQLSGIPDDICARFYFPGLLELQRRWHLMWWVSTGEETNLHLWSSNLRQMLIFWKEPRWHKWRWKCPCSATHKLILWEQSFLIMSRAHEIYSIITTLLWSHWTCSDLKHMYSFLLGLSI